MVNGQFNQTETFSDVLFHQIVNILRSSFYFQSNLEDFSQLLLVLQLIRKFTSFFTHSFFVSCSM